MFIFPVQLTTSRIGNLTWLIHTLLYVMTIHTYIGAAYIGCHALVLGRVVAASARGNLPSLLERLPERPMASALFGELKIVVTEAKIN